jgi:hypothetical protein
MDENFNFNRTFLLVIAKYRLPDVKLFTALQDLKASHIIQMEV